MTQTKESASMRNRRSGNRNRNGNDNRLGEARR